MGDLLSPEEVAARLRLSRRTVIVWLQRGKLPGIKVGSRWRVRADDLDAFVEPGPDKPIRPAPRTPEDPDDPILNVIGCITAAPIPAKDINKLVYGKEDQ